MSTPCDKHLAADPILEDHDVHLQCPAGCAVLTDHPEAVQPGAVAFTPREVRMLATALGEVRPLPPASLGALFEAKRVLGGSVVAARRLGEH